MKETMELKDLSYDELTLLHDNMYDHKGKKRKKIKKDLSYYYVNDMQYRGPLNILKLRVIGWAFMVLTAFCTGMALFASVSNWNSTVLMSIFAPIGSLSLSALMIASFSYILQKKDNSKKILLVYGLAAAGLAGGFYLLYFLYAANLWNALTKIGYVESVMKLNSLFLQKFGNVTTYNVFIDLFMFALSAFFLYYTPKKLDGKKLLAFRFLTIFPLIYIIAAFIVKASTAFGNFAIPIYIIPILPTKSPMLFLAFYTVSLSVKYREYKFKKKGKTDEEYQKMFMSNGNSWLVAKSFAKSLIIFGIIDLLLVIVSSIIVACNLGAAEQYEALINSLIDENGQVIAGKEDLFDLYVDMYNTYKYFADCFKLFSTEVGIGTAVYQVLIVPIVLLFSFNRIHESSKWDILVPITGVGGIVFTYYNWGFIIILTMAGSFGGMIPGL